MFFFIKKNFFFDYLRKIYNIYRAYAVSNSDKKALNVFKRIGLYNDLKLTKDNWKPNYNDLRFLYNLIIKKRFSTILEFGTGFSTIVMAAALKVNSVYNSKNYKIYTVETENRWIDPVKKKLQNKYKQYSEIIHSKANTKLIQLSLCSIYEKLPNITPDLIYLDGPDPDCVKSKMFNLNYEKSNNPISADILLYEYKLRPGAIIIVDGRPNNVIFLRNHLKRKYKFEFNRLYSRSIFQLIE